MTELDVRLDDDNDAEVGEGVEAMVVLIARLGLQGLPAVAAPGMTGGAAAVGEEAAAAASPPTADAAAAAAAAADITAAGG